MTFEGECIAAAGSALVQEAAVAREETSRPSLSLRDAGGGDRDSTPISSCSDNIVHLARPLSVSVLSPLES